eukprot:sb/3475091/
MTSWDIWDGLEAPGTTQGAPRTAKGGGPRDRLGQLREHQQQLRERLAQPRGDWKDSPRGPRDRLGQLREHQKQLRERLEQPRGAWEDSPSTLDDSRSTWEVSGRLKGHPRCLKEHLRGPGKHLGRNKEFP